MSRTLFGPSSVLIVMLTLLTLSCTEKQPATELSATSTDGFATSASISNSGDPLFTRDTRVERDCSDTLTPDDPTYGFNPRFYTIRDLATDRRYDVELCASGLLLLRDADRVIDTVATEGHEVYFPDHGLDVVHERIVANSAGLHSSVAYRWVRFIAVVDGRWVRLGDLLLADGGENDRSLYEVEYVINPNTLELVATERYVREREHRERPNDRLNQGSVVRLDTLDRWEETRSLTLDRRHWAYVNTNITLDDVPTDDGAIITGTYPGVVMRGREPRVFVKGQWFAVEKSDDFEAYIGSMRRRYSGVDHKTILSARK